MCCFGQDSWKNKLLRPMYAEMLAPRSSQQKNINYLKGGIFISYEEMLIRRKELDKEILELREQIAKLPEGRLMCTRNGNYRKWYVCDRHKQTYIPKKDRIFAERLAAKKYLSELLEDKLREKRAVEAYLELCPRDAGAELLLNPQSPFAELLTSHFKCKAQRAKIWANAPFEQSKKHPEHLNHPCLSGNTVRSKSESMIDACLYQKGIPFRYEAALHLGDTIIYPDFTILHPVTEKIYYWEHLGLLNKKTYPDSVFFKMRLYISNGIIPSINLILTTETSENPLSTTKVERIVREYFC